MHMRIILFAFVFLLGGVYESRNIKLEVKVNKEEVFQDEILKLEVSINFTKRGEIRLKVPELEDFEILAKYESRTLEKKAGKTYFQFKTTFFLLPKKTGELVIGPFRAGSCKSLPIKIKVKPKEEKPKEEKSAPVIPSAGDGISL